MIIKKRLNRYLIYIISLLIIINISYALPYIYRTDDWDADEGSDIDGAIFVDYEIFPETLSITDMDADMLCYDWNDDGTYDNCYWDSNGCGSSCDADSCDYYAVPYYMPDGWKDGCDIDGGLGGCKIGDDVASRICGTCDGIDTSTEQTSDIDAVVYYDCDNSQSNRHVDSLDETTIYVVKPKKYDCESGGASDYDYEGDYASSGSTWVDIKTDISCGSSSLDCDENHDDDLVYTAYGSINDPCRTKNWYSCSSDGDCISDKCEQYECSTCSDSQCTSAHWDSCTNNGALCCSGDPVFGQYHCAYYEDWTECSTGSHTGCQQKGNYYCTLESGDWRWRTCTFGCSGDSCTEPDIDVSPSSLTFNIGQ